MKNKMASYHDDKYPDPNSCSIIEEEARGIEFEMEIDELGERVVRLEKTVTDLVRFISRNLKYTPKS
mgnify:CR=1 FL=1|jgi:hypothetical protein